MTRKEWLRAVSTGNYPRNIFYTFYTEQNKDKDKEYSHDEFNQYFQLYRRRAHINTILDTITKHYNKKFKINKVTDLNNNSLKYY
jgi:hypothetical protein